MNLVAKENGVAGPEDGVLILSEFAGAAAQLQHDAILVNPYYAEAIADAIHHAWTMHTEERGLAMRRLRRTIREHDVFWWVDTFLNPGQAAQYDHSLRLDNGGWTSQMWQFLQAQKKTLEIIG